VTAINLLIIPSLLREAGCVLVREKQILSSGDERPLTVRCRWSWPQQRFSLCFPISSAHRRSKQFFFQVPMCIRQPVTVLQGQQLTKWCRPILCHATIFQTAILKNNAYL
jgi:hypothetical protein